MTEEMLIIREVLKNQVWADSRRGMPRRGSLCVGGRLCSRTKVAGTLTDKWIINELVECGQRFQQV